MRRRTRGRVGHPAVARGVRRGRGPGGLPGHGLRVVCPRRVGGAAGEARPVGPLPEAPRRGDRDHPVRGRARRRGGTVRAGPGADRPGARVESAVRGRSRGGGRGRVRRRRKGEGAPVRPGGPGPRRLDRRGARRGRAPGVRGRGRRPGRLGLRRPRGGGRAFLRGGGRGAAGFSDRQLARRRAPGRPGAAPDPRGRRRARLVDVSGGPRGARLARRRRERHPRAARQPADDPVGVARPARRGPGDPPGPPGRAAHARGRRDSDAALGRNPVRARRRSRVPERLPGTVAGVEGRNPAGGAVRPAVRIGGAAVGGPEFTRGLDRLRSLLPAGEGHEP